MERFLLFLCVVLLYCVNGFASTEKANKDEGKKTPPRFHIYMENETLYLNPLRSSISVQIINEWNDVVYEEYVNIDQPQSYCIPIGFLEPGDYKLVVSGENLNYTFEFYL